MHLQKVKLFGGALFKRRLLQNKTNFALCGVRIFYALLYGKSFPCRMIAERLGDMVILYFFRAVKVCHGSCNL